MNYCLASQDIRERIKRGIIAVPQKKITKEIESRIQPASFEPSIGDYIWEIDMSFGSFGAPSAKKTVQQIINDAPSNRRVKHSIKGGFELKRGHSYLVPLNETILLRKGEVVGSSPKSSTGRLFPKLRLMADYNPCFDEVHAHYKTGAHISMWLLLEPQAFDLILHPNLILNQLRFYVGDPILSDAEVRTIHEKTPLILARTFYGDLKPVKDPIIYEGIQLHLDLLGEHSNGIIGLRARNVATPIDMKKLNHYDIDQFFDVLTRTEELVVRRGEFYLFFSKEVLSTPKNLNFELKDHSHIGLQGPLHFAGFIDNGFVGDLVFEVRSDELHDFVLRDGMPLSRLTTYKTRTTPDKVYGGKIGSNYQGQIGARAAKYFKKIQSR